MEHKNFLEMYQIDVKPYVEQRDGIDYLPWAMCKMLLHKNGWEKVMFYPLYDEQTGSTLFMSPEVFTDRKGETNRCYEVRVRIVLDDDSFIQNYPVINQTAIVKDSTMNQLRVSNAQARAFVKGVAMFTGLGFSLWTNGMDESERELIQTAESVTDVFNTAVYNIQQQGGTHEDIIAAIQKEEKFHTVDSWEKLKLMYMQANKFKDVTAYLGEVSKTFKK